MDDLNRTQFVYERKIEVPPVKEDTEKGIIAADGYTKIVKDSFNVETIIRTIVMDDGHRLVLLDDIHERFENKPKTHPKTGAPVFDKKGQMIFERVKETFQSEIHLSAEEGEELLTLMKINNG